MQENHIVTVTFKPKSDQQTAFETVLQSVKTELPKVEGCLGVRVLKHQNDPSTFLLIEDWKTAELHNAHITRLIESGEWAALEQMLSEPPSSNVLVQI